MFTKNVKNSFETPLFGMHMWKRSFQTFVIIHFSFLNPFSETFSYLKNLMHVYDNKNRKLELLYWIINGQFFLAENILNANEIYFVFMENRFSYRRIEWLRFDIMMKLVLFSAQFVSQCWKLHSIEWKRQIRMNTKDANLSSCWFRERANIINNKTITKANKTQSNG